MIFSKQLALATVLGALATQSFAAFDLRISEMWAGNDPGSNLTEDWFEIVNTGDTSWTSGVDGALYYDDESADTAGADPITGIASIASGEAVVVVITNSSDGVDEFTSVWSPVYDLNNVKIGMVDGAGLGGGGDAVTLYVGDPTSTGLQVDYATYPDTSANGGQSYDVALAAFSTETSTQELNDASQAAFGTPGNQGPVSSSGDAPEITLLGDNPLMVTRLSSYTDPGATATDTEDGDLTAQIVVSGDTVNTARLGDYEVNYDVADVDGNPAATVTRTVKVSPPERIPAVIPTPYNPDLFRHVATVSGLPGAEIPAYDPDTQQAFVTSGSGLQIVDLHDITNPVVGDLIDPTLFPNINSSAVTSVASCKGLVAIAVPSDPQTDNGHVIVATAQGSIQFVPEVGALPDMVTFNEDCSKILVANEGEPASGVDPEGSISIIDAATGEVQTAGFTAFNGQEDALRAEGVRIFPGVDAANDFEPEYIAIGRTPGGDERAYVTLQEANSIAVVDIANAQVVDIVPLGLKDHSLPINRMDASDKDGVINMRRWPLYGMYMPDAIAGYRINDNQFLITANEGDARASDERVADLTLDPTAFPGAALWQNDFNIGRIKVSSIDGDTDNDGDYDHLQSYGARSFTIWKPDGRLIYDSGYFIEAIIAAHDPDSFVDSRSDDKGPEPEGVEIGRLGRNTMAFIGLERTSHILVFNVTRPTRPRLAQVLYHEGDVSPEGMKYLQWNETSNHCQTLLVTNEVSNTLSIYQYEGCAGRQL